MRRLRGWARLRESRHSGEGGRGHRHLFPAPGGPRTADVSSLDLSFNNIRHVPNLPSIKALTVLYLVQNKITRIDKGALDWCASTITSIELGGNRIRVSRSLTSVRGFPHHRVPESGWVLGRRTSGERV